MGYVSFLEGMQSIYTGISTVSSTHGCSVLPSRQGNLRSLLHERSDRRSGKSFPSARAEEIKPFSKRSFCWIVLEYNYNYKNKTSKSAYVYIYIDSFQLCFVELLYKWKVVFFFPCYSCCFAWVFYQRQYTRFCINLKLTISSSEKSRFLLSVKSQKEDS